MNKTDDEGLKIYYSKAKSILVVVVFGILFLVQLIYSLNTQTYWLGLISILYLYYFRIGFVHLKYKDPIFIYKNGNLFYTKNSKTYTFENHDFEKKFYDKYNWSQSICIYDLANNRLVVENLWYIKDTWEIDSIIKKMKLRKLLKIKNKQFNY